MAVHQRGDGADRPAVRVPRGETRRAVRSGNRADCRDRLLDGFRDLHEIRRGGQSAGATFGVERECALRHRRDLLIFACGDVVRHWQHRPVADQVSRTRPF